MSLESNRMSEDKRKVSMELDFSELDTVAGGWEYTPDNQYTCRRCGYSWLKREGKTCPECEGTPYSY